VDINKSLLEESGEELFDSAPCGYVTTLPDGGILKVNQTFLNMTGYSREALSPEVTFQQLLPLPAKIFYDTHVAPLLLIQGFVREIAADLNRHDRRVLPVLLNFTQKRNSQGQAVLTRITIFDATDRRQYERDLLQARREAELAAQVERKAREVADRANRAKDDLLALVSHELKTPLSAIIGWSHLLRRKFPGNKVLEDGLSVIDRNARLQATLVDDLLDTSRLAAGKMRLDVQQCDLTAILQASLDTVRPAAEARSIRLQPILDPTLKVSGDPGRLQQIFWNILSNAVKFTPRDGFVRVVVERVDSHVEVRIADNGPGMSQAFIEHAFDQFSQSSSLATRATTGLGLGLSLAKHLTEMHGGSISAHSEGEGRGCTFIVRLPVLILYPNESDAPVDLRRSANVDKVNYDAVSLTGLKLLIVEDERDAREFLWHLLTERGAEVVSAADAAEALSIIERFHADVLISDIGLPGQDGYELIRQVRMGERSRIPAIALTAQSRLEDRTRALLAGFQMYLAKPIDAAELTVTIASLAGRLRASQKTLL
jgi:PAS domain S-box-containing protein